MRKLLIILGMLLSGGGSDLHADTIRQTVAAGRFYPADPVELYRQIDQALAASPRLGLRGVRAVVVPHAGYEFSAQVAAAAFREVNPDFRRVFILASNHSNDVNLSGVSVADEAAYEIPGTKIPVSPIAAELLREKGFVREPAVHAMHMIEVELPFLHSLRGRPASPDFEIIPLILGRMDQDAVRRLADRLERYVDNRTLFVFSVDLSHYYTDERARALDTQTIQAIMSRDTEALSRSVTDGNQVLLTLVEMANRRHWEPTMLLYKNTADATGDRGRVVGYSSIAFHPPFSLSPKEKTDLLRLARRTVEETVRSGKMPPDTAPSNPIFGIRRGVFVTLKKKGGLRGCIGSLFPETSLMEGVRKNAVKAATRDVRFSPVTREELGDLSYSISILDYPRRVEATRPSELATILRPREDGVILISGGRQSTFLPQVWEEIPKPEDFLSRLCQKQGSPGDCWKLPDTSLFRYHAAEFAEISPRHGP